jgi:hypothetical protein
MNKQQRREYKRKRREKIRKEHLEAFRSKRENDEREELLSSTKRVSSVIPDRNDQLGWSRFNKLEPSLIIRKAFKTHPTDKTLKMFLSEPTRLSKADTLYIADMLTEAVQAIQCNSPWYVPLVRLVRETGGFSLYTFAFELKKKSTPNGAAWYVVKFNSSQDIIAVKERYYQLTFSTHAIERINERFISKNNPMAAVVLFNNIEPLSPIYSGTDRLIPLTSATDPTRRICGYCPFIIHDNMVIAKSFLIPTMDGTPERNTLLTYGIDTSKFSVESYGELFTTKAKETLHEYGINTDTFMPPSVFTTKSEEVTV